MPVWASLLGSFLLDEAITRAKLIGLALGMSGLAVLIGPDLIVLETAPLGPLFMLMAAVSWATGTVLLKRFHWSVPTTVLVGWQLIAGALPVTLGAVLLEAPPELSRPEQPNPSWRWPISSCFPWFSANGHFSEPCVSSRPPSRQSGTLAIPVVGVYSSAVILGESVGWREFIALMLICRRLGQRAVAGRAKIGTAGVRVPPISWGASGGLHASILSQVRP